MASQKPFRAKILYGFLALLLLLIFMAFNPFKASVESLPNGFSEKNFNTGKVVLNYIEGPDNGPPLLFIPGQTETWHGYKLVIPNFVENYHIFVVEVRGHGKSTRTTGDYSYNIIGQDLKLFLQQVVKQPAIVSGLSSGAVVSLWLAANAPDNVLAAISEDPPLFSSMWPQIKREKYMYYLFETLVETMGKPERDFLAYYKRLGIPQDDQDELMLIPSFVAKFLAGRYTLHKKLRPSKPYDIPFSSFEAQIGYKFLAEYDVDFSKATIDGRLAAGFEPEEVLAKIGRPLLLIQANWSRHKTWGLVGALDDDGVKTIRSLVKNLTVNKVNSSHGVHLAQPETFSQVVNDFLIKLDLKK